MNTTFFQRILFHTYRFRSQLIYGSFLSGVYILLFVFLYPGEDGVATYSDAVTETYLAGLLTLIDTGNPGWTFWLAMSTGLILYFTFSICAILMGRKLVPSQDRDALEIFLGVNPQPARQFYLENLLAAILNLVAMSIPTFLILTIGSIINDASDIIGRLVLTYIFVLIVATVFLVISSLIAVMNFSGSTGMKVGMGYLFFALFMELTFADNPSTRDYANLSVNYYAKTSAGLVSGSYDWSPISVILLLIIAGISATYWKVKYPDYLETEIKTPDTIDISEIEFVAGTKLSHRYPLFFDQLRNDFKALITLIIAVSLIVIMISNSYIEETIDEVLAASDSPSMRALIQNNELQYNYTGFFAIKIFALYWAYFGIFIVLISSNVATREVRFDSQDILWGNNIKANNLVNSRTLAVLMETTVFIWSIFIVQSIFEILLDREINRLHVFEAYSVMWIHFLGLTLFMIALSMVPAVSKGRNLSLMTFVIFILTYILAFSSTKIEFLKYINYLGYLDIVGLLYGQENYVVALLTSTTLGLISTGFYYWALTIRYQNKDLL
ncbi:MAG: hypothetical protein ACXAD7_06755 [Candidatus Kariarchaeaceae archaeon]